MPLPMFTYILMYNVVIYTLYYSVCSWIGWQTLNTPHPRVTSGHQMSSLSTAPSAEAMPNLAGGWFRLISWHGKNNQQCLWKPWSQGASRCTNNASWFKYRMLSVWCICLWNQPYELVHVMTEWTLKCWGSRQMWAALGKEDGVLVKREGMPSCVQHVLPFILFVVWWLVESTCQLGKAINPARRSMTSFIHSHFLKQLQYEQT